jgi:hypothetical protein
MRFRRNWEQEQEAREVFPTVACGRLRSSGVGWAPLAGSLLLHLACGAGLLLVPDSPPARRTVYEVSRLSLQQRDANRKIIWYRIQEKLPAVTPGTPPTLNPARGRHKAPQSIVADSSAPKPASQLIWQKAPELPKQVDLRSPNLLAVELRPPPAPIPRKAFAPPPPRRRVPPPTRLDLGAAPEVAATPAPLSSIKLPVPAGEARPAPRKFVPPVRSPRGGSAGGEGTLELLTEGAPSIADSAAGPSQAALAILGPKPAGRPEGLVPPGSQSALLSGSPSPSPDARGRPSGVAGAAVEIPGVMVKGGGGPPASGEPVAAVPPRPVPEKLPPADQVNLASLEKWQQDARVMMAVALRPGARVIPAAIDSSFRDRPVYTTTFQMPNGNGAFTDWVVWFAERQPGGGAVLPMRPPVPWHRINSAGPISGNGQTGTGRVRLAVVIQKNGLLDEPVIISARNAAAVPGALALLREWRFLPAVRNAEPVDVDAIIEIEFP